MPRSFNWVRVVRGFFFDVGNAGFAEKEVWPMAREPDAEAKPVIIPDASLQPLPGIHHYYRDLCAGIDKRS